MSNRPPTDIDDTLKATTVVLNFLPKIAGVSLGVSVLGYVMGWREASTYYTQIGAPWALSLLSPTQILQTSIWLITVLLISSTLCVYELTQGHASPKGLRKASIVFLFLAGLALIASLFVESPNDNFLDMVASCLFVVSAGMTIGELIACLASTNLKWGKYESFLMFFVFFFCLSFAIHLMGSAKAKNSTNLASTTLPRTTLLTQHPEDRWRLVSPLDGKMLLIRISDKKVDHRFKLVTVEEIDEIKHSTK